MKKLFVHNPLFRLLSPVFSGVVVYLLILLVNNNVTQLQEHFLGEELYFCIGLSYVIQEFSRLLLVLFKYLPKLTSEITKMVLELVFAMVLSIALVTLCLYLYYENVLGFTPSSEDLWMFNSIFSVITLIYVLLFISHQYLYKVNTEKLSQEIQIKQHIEADFNDFKAGINPNLLFESFETLVVLLKQNKNEAEDFIDLLATMYRYILSSKQQQLVAVSQEVEHANSLVSLFNKLPYRSISLQNNTTSDFLIVPRSLLFLIEQIVRTTIISADIQLEIYLNEFNDSFEIKYKHKDRISEPFNFKKLEEIERVYNIYSTKKIEILEDDEWRSILFPKLTEKTN